MPHFLHLLVLRGQWAVLLPRRPLIPLRPHVFGDALADLVAVIKLRLARASGLPAGQPVAARVGKDGRKEGRKGEMFEKGEVWKGNKNRTQEIIIPLA